MVRRARLAATWLLLPGLAATGGCSPDGSGPSSSPAAAVPPAAASRLEDLASGYETLPTGGVWYRELLAESRPELLLPSIGIAAWSRRIDPSRGREVRDRALADLRAAARTGAAGAALPAVVALAVTGGDVRAHGPDLLSTMPSERAGLLELRIDALSQPVASRPEVDCRGVADALGRPGLDPSVQATVVLSKGPGRCQQEAPEMVQRFCDSPASWSIPDRVLDLVVLLPDRIDELAVCADRQMQEVAGRATTDLEIELQLHGPLAWLASAAPERGRVDAALATEAAKVVEEGGRTQFPDAASPLADEDLLAAAVLDGLGLLDPPVAAAVDLEVSRTGRWTARPPCAEPVGQAIELSPAESSGAPTATLDLVLERLGPCAFPEIDRPQDPLAGLFVHGAALIGGCLNAGRAGSVPDVSTAGIPPDLAGDRTVTFLSDLATIAPEHLCRAVRSALDREPGS